MMSLSVEHSAIIKIVNLIVVVNYIFKVIALCTFCYSTRHYSNCGNLNVGFHAVAKVLVIPTQAHATDSIRDAYDYRTRYDYII